MHTSVRAALAATAVAAVALTGCATKTESPKADRKEAPSKEATERKDEKALEESEKKVEDGIDMSKVTRECERWAGSLEKTMGDLNTDDPDTEEAIAGLEAIRKDAPDAIAGDLDTLIRWAHEVLPAVEEMQKATESGQQLTEEQIAKASEIANSDASGEVNTAVNNIQAYLEKNCGVAHDESTDTTVGD